MEDMARLALVEQNVRDVDTFSKILYELLRHINHILENPHDYELRIIRSEILRTVLKYEAFVDYLKSIGFQSVGSDFTYPKEQTLSNLRVAQAAIERKIYFCCGSVSHTETKLKSGNSLPVVRKPKFTPSKILNTDNAFLKQIESTFNNMIKYEDEELQETARKHVPLVTLQLMALDRMREHQRKIKAGELEGRDMPFDIALLMELLGWFKYKFFSWVDAPTCDACGGNTTHTDNTVAVHETETCKVERYRCTVCGGLAEFPRYNEPRTLLRTRRGRCGEWANCFTLLARALGYEARYVLDTTDHVWCEVFDFEAGAWLHVDPCEGALDAPLTYSRGWGKRLAYVVAFSRDDLQDVTWRYTTDHPEVLSRRTLCSEAALLAAILSLREHRQRGLSDARRRYLARRCLDELVQLMVERSPTDSETHGRISGSRAWRSGRGELGRGRTGHVFRFHAPGTARVRYFPSDDRYIVDSSDGNTTLSGWDAGIFTATGVARNVENDWKMVYLAREEGESTGSVSWKIATEGDNLEFTSLSIQLTAQLFENGSIDWTVAFDDENPIPTKFGDTATVFSRRFSRATLEAVLRGGRGGTAWQHAQLFRQPLADSSCGLDLQVRLERH